MALLEKQTERLTGSSDGSERSRFPLLATAVWFALVTWTLETVVFAINKYVVQYFSSKGRYVLLVGIVADLAFLLVAAGGLGLARRMWKPAGSARIAVFVFAFLGTVGVLTNFHMFQAIALGLLCLGVAFQASRLVAAREERFVAFVRRTLRPLAISVAVFALSALAYLRLGEPIALAALPAPPSGAPNVLLIVLDTVRASSMSLYGYGRNTTPRLAEFAASGTVFDFAIATAPWTEPTHATLFTGRYHHEVSANWLKPLDDTWPTLAERLTSRGYRTAGFVGNMRYCGRHTGLARGFARYEDLDPYSLDRVLESSGLTDRLWAALRKVDPSLDATDPKAKGIVESFLEWESRSRDRPFFAFVNLYEAHEPYKPPPPFDRMFSEKPVAPFSLKRSGQGATPQQIEHARTAYDGEIAFLDDRVGALLAELRSRGVLENTLVVVTSDHGEHFGEHGYMSHGNSLYLPLLRVPLLLVMPERVPAGLRVAEPVSLRDLAVTIDTMCGSDSATPFPGSSLARFWTPGDTHARSSPVIAEVRPAFTRQGRLVSESAKWLRSIVVGRYHYILDVKSGDEELYDVASDPDEQTNLAQTESGREIAARMRAALEGRMD